MWRGGSYVEIFRTGCSDDPDVPEHVRGLYGRSCEGLEEVECAKLKELIIKYEAVFSKSEWDLGHYQDIKFKIDTGDARPVKQRMRRTPLGFVDEEKAFLENLLAQGIIEIATSEWASPSVLVRKKDGGVRWCVDYRRLNSVTVKDSYPMPIIEECVDALAGSRYFSTLDLASGFYQIEVAEEDRDKTAFLTKYGLFRFVRMPFGLTNAPAIFGRVMTSVLRGLLWEDAVAFLDDVMVSGASFDDHLCKLE